MEIQVQDASVTTPPNPPVLGPTTPPAFPAGNVVSGPMSQADVLSIMAANFNGMLGQHESWVRTLAKQEVLAYSGDIKVMRDALSSMKLAKDADDLLAIKKNGFWPQVLEHSKTAAAVIVGGGAVIIANKLVGRPGPV